MLAFQRLFAPGLRF